MKRFSLSLLILIVPFALMAVEHDLKKSKGTDQWVISKLKPAPAKDNVQPDAVIKAFFILSLNPENVKGRNVRLHRISDTKRQRIEGKVRYRKAKNVIVFEPKQELSSGVYEMTYKRLTIKYYFFEFAIETIKFRFAVIEEKPDITPPVITLHGEPSMMIPQDGTYTEPGATATDNRDGSVAVTISGNVDISTLGTYTIIYTATDAAGNNATATRTINVVLPLDTTAPVITLNGESEVIIHEGETYIEKGATAEDDRDGSVAVTISGTVDSSKLDTYTVTYAAKDSAGNTSTAIRTVKVIDVTPPVIALNGQNPTKLFIGQPYIELGAIAVDKIDGEVSVVIGGAVDVASEGNYTIIYSATDAAGNRAEITRTVQVATSQLVSLALESNATTLRIGDKVLLRLEGSYEDGSTKELTNDITWVQTPTGSVEIHEMVLTATGSIDMSLQAKIGNITSNGVRFAILVSPSFTPKVPDKDSNISIEYNHITIEAEATQAKTLEAINQTLSRDHNRTIRIRGADNNGTFYLYNVPLTKGVNEINITATSEDNLSVSKTIVLNADANGSVPIGMRAGQYSGVGSLETTVEVGTLLSVDEYLFDQEGDGTIDMTQSSSDSNFTVHLTQEARYKPRVTIRTEDGLLFSSGDYALSLDVKGDANQSDPKGFEPVDIASRYVNAIMENDRQTVERLLGHNQRMISYVYAKPEVQKLLADTYAKIISWEQAYHGSGYASVKIIFDVNGTQYGGGFEMNVADSYGSTSGRHWFIRFFY